MKNNLIKCILHLLYPTRCPVCGTFIGISDKFCPECSEKLAPFTGAFAIDGAAGFYASFVYDENISPAVILLKKGICGNADYALGQALGEKLTECGLPHIDGIIPVPMYSADRRRRGYNQAELIARHVSEVISVPVIKNAVVKKKATEQQKMLSGQERRENLKGAFFVEAPELIKGKSLLILDDVCTTGSTLSELTKLLISSGAKEIFCAACCKTEHRTEHKEM